MLLYMLRDTDCIRERLGQSRIQVQLKDSPDRFICRLLTSPRYYHQS